ncbi:MAG: ACT domain-containing protein [Tabrizicola sp.]|uniref:ACT domain-containing protein n=1 Tax=Tabrizicola sp. TaxID=2005166 RepID=UPI0027363F48|nr:ACT domain-containing protein [Tabrizicola sp.]MDP3261464.1 ACT domain-containing protein [Tabrizicola sp.]MDP3649253.1 ACT domain-containing protein [Paracoccaceae bacterium]MDZ4069563.1 ACT domain-containing protein [Tabrizicola sp.]
MGERDLTVLLKTMQPVLHAEPYGYAVTTSRDLPFQPFATMAEAEGITVVAPLAAIRAAGLTSEAWARISLSVHSDLAAVGLTAAVAGALASAGVSCNVVAGYYHDHLFTAWDERDIAMAVLQELAVG